MNIYGNEKEFDLIKITSTKKGKARVYFNTNFSILLSSMKGQNQLLTLSKQLKDMFSKEVDHLINEYIDSKK